MTWFVLLIGAGVLLLTGFVVGLVFLILFLVQRLGGTTGGWRRLFEVYPSMDPPAGLPDNPGFDLLSIRPGGEKRAIEVKGRAGVGEVEVSANEWAKACNLRDGC